MAMNPLPPQAYTKETMLKAYSWLQNQDRSIQEMATTSDILVSLYLKATRDGDAVLDRPSIQNFKHELKQIAGMMGEFDKDIPVDKLVASVEREMNQSNYPQYNPQPLSTMESQSKVKTKKEIPGGELVKSQPGPGFSMLQLDEKSLQIVAETRNHLNLSSDLEALKVLIQIGFNKAKKLF